MVFCVMFQTVAVWSVLVITALAADSKLPLLRCQSEDCVELPKDSLWPCIAYRVEGKQLKVSQNTSTLHLDCQNGTVLESRALPVANPAVEVPEIVLINCTLPTNRSIAEILTVFNVSLKYNKAKGTLIFDGLPPATTLTAAHFIDLEDLNHLRILGTENSPPTLAPECLKPLKNLEMLKIKNVFATDLEVSASLRSLIIYYSDLNRLPVAPALEILIVYNSKKSWLTSLPCKSLQKIKLVGPLISYLPNGWLKNCLVLKDLEISRAGKLSHLPATLLQDTGSLRRLSLTRNSLIELPVGFLNYTPKLQVLELYQNEISTLQRGIFAETRQIEKLDLSSNRLERSDLAALAPLVQLTELNLADNPLVEFLCEENGYSTLQNMTELKKLSLSSNHHVSRICLDWKYNMTQLQYLDLDHTSLENITELDLRYNYIKSVDEETAKRIQKMDGLLRLGGNSMDCSCHAAPLLRALHARNETLTDLSNATCTDGTLLLAAPIIDCPISLKTVGTWLAGVFAVVLVVVVVGVKFFWSQQRRFFARAVLHRWGVRWRVDEPANDDRKYDAFLTFSHKDTAVARAVVTRLEPQYRLCVHLRDWTPGELILEQITKSVQESRRTVALVSRHFLESKWAQAEFWEAHTASMLDARPRLVVVLLEEPGALQMDEKLRGYIATHTYLRWEESLFWDKLAVALPRPRPSAYLPPQMEWLPLLPYNPESNASESFLVDIDVVDDDVD